ncbi:MAG TPA: discoidin domain-containing protein [Allosphingosinicella sp.]|nr:discoidin domain-containing protein [Allosphingosinicella sp.]
MRLWAGALFLILSLPGGSAAAQQAGLLDDFSRPTAWRVEASDGVTAAAAPFEGGLALDYDFSRGSGYAVLHRDLPLELPENFELRFRVRGQGGANNLEVKLVDATGANVWWHRELDFVAPAGWTTLRVRRRQIEFAWGPTQDRTLRRMAAIEFVVSAGSGGGRGRLAIDDLTMTPLPVPPAVPPRPTASSRDGNAAAAIDGDPATAWTAHTGAFIDLDLGYRREFGGLVLRWAAGRHAPTYVIALSDDGRRFRFVHAAHHSDGDTDWIRLAESEARYVRIQTNDGPPGGPALTEVEIEPLAFGASANAFVSAVAAAQPRGTWPRAYIGEQNYWTLVAPPTGGNGGLLDEAGAIEAGRGGFSVEPFVQEGDRLTSWADAEISDALLDGDLPIPRVQWRGPGWTLGITVFAQGDRLVARYRLRNLGGTMRELALVLAIRPLQVNPPQQFLNIAGGVSPIESLTWTDNAIMVNGRTRVRPGSPPDQVRFSPFESGPLPQSLASADPRAIAVDDPTGLASGALVYRLHLAAGETREIAVAVATAAGAPLPAPVDAAAAERTAARAWREQLDRVSLRGPAVATPVFATLRSALAQILMTREGPALRPGSRSYARSWIRDGAMMSTALLRLGHADAAADFLEYYAPFQYPDGKVPCCVDARGADPVAENDSDGELIHLVAQLQRYAPDAARLRRMWSHVAAAAGHIERLRQSTRVPANLAGPTRAFFGLLPPSISHEGYSAQPMHSYWDDFWGLTGLKDAAWLAGELGNAGEARRLAAAADEFRADILASLAAARDIHGIAFIPGAADLGDFDPTSTTVALSPGGEQARLPRDALTATFERYWSEFVARRDGRRAWDAYTPYEWRNVGAFVRLGWWDRATALADFLMADRRPAGWNQWAEVVGREPRAPRFLGDMPHGWVASDFINATLDRLAFERASDGALVLAAGVPNSWLEGGGIAVSGLRTPFGRLSYSLRAQGGRARLTYRLDGRSPPGGLVLGWRMDGLRLRGLRGTAEVSLP